MNPSIQSQMLQARSLTPTGIPSALPSPEQKHQFLNDQYKTAMKQLQRKYAGQLSPVEMQKVHFFPESSNITPSAKYGMIIRPN